ncbi:MAG: AbgT family transporter, partial [Bacteroidota bacterium]
YSFAFLFLWIVLLVAWLLLGLPLGPDAGIHYVMPK